MTLLQLFDVFELPGQESTLAKIACVKEQLSLLGLHLLPDVDRGELDSVRRVDFREAPSVSQDTVRMELKNLEGSTLEFKSSLLFDRVRAAHDKSASPSDLRSENVLHSTLKSIGAFLNTGGGILYLGVDDEGNCVGIEPDFPYVGSSGAGGLDEWELFLRDIIKSRFKDGEIINDYVRCQSFCLDGATVARIQISPRSHLSFLHGKNGCQLYRRQGNRTEQVSIEQVEEFLRLRQQS